MSYCILACSLWSAESILRQLIRLILQKIVTASSTTRQLMFHRITNRGCSLAIARHAKRSVSSVAFHCVNVSSVSSVNYLINYFYSVLLH